jgi:nucleotide-binding universal stress UspA family protein
MSTTPDIPETSTGLPRNILVAFDGSQHARRALQQAVSLARASRGTLTLLEVVHQPRIFVSAYAAPLPSDAELLAEAEAEVARAVRSVPEDVAVRGLAVVGDAAEEILQQAATGEHDLIVMGTRGHGEAVSLAIGSVSHSVIQRAAVPVLVIRDVTAVAHEDITATPVGALAGTE